MRSPRPTHIYGPGYHFERITGARIKQNELLELTRPRGRPSYMAEPADAYVITMEQAGLADPRETKAPIITRTWWPHLWRPSVFRHVLREGEILRDLTIDYEQGALMGSVTFPLVVVTSAYFGHIELRSVCHISPDYLKATT